MRILVLHEYHGCESGCCGHVVTIDGKPSKNADIPWSGLSFAHPCGEDHRKFAEDLIREQLGEEHIKDLDWDNSVVMDD